MSIWLFVATEAVSGPSPPEMLELLPSSKQADLYTLLKFDSGKAVTGCLIRK
jgi:hypothetical protein